jgi:hypothetical protein
MLQTRLVLLMLALLVVGNACQNSESMQGKSVAERRADEQRRRNPIKKGIYRCWQLSAAGDSIAPDLYMLSDDMYQVDDVTGMYRYHHASNSIEWLDGPMYSATEKRTGVYRRKGSATTGGGHTLETMIQVQAKSAADTALRNIVQCNCVEKE